MTGEPEHVPKASQGRLSAGAANTRITPIKTPAASSPKGGSIFFREELVQKKPVRRCGIGKEEQLGQELSEVKA